MLHAFYPVCFLYTISKGSLLKSKYLIPNLLTSCTKGCGLFCASWRHTRHKTCCREASHISGGAIKKSLSQVVRNIFAPIETSPGVYIYSTVPLAKLSGKVTAGSKGKGNLLQPAQRNVTVFKEDWFEDNDQRREAEVREKGNCEG